MGSAAILRRPLQPVQLLREHVPEARRWERSRSGQAVLTPVARDAGRALQARAAAGGDSSDETVVFICATGRLHVRSAAVLRAVAHLAPWWLYALCMMALFIPTCLRDAIYKFVARNRIWFFGAGETCRRATAEDKKHFL